MILNTILDIKEHLMLLEVKVKLCIDINRSKFIVGMCFKFGLLLLQVFRPQFVVFLPLGTSYSSRNSTETLAT